LGELTKLVSGSVFDGVAKIISLFKVDPAVAMENQTKIFEIQTEMQGKILDAAQAQFATASANIQSEEKSGDKFTMRARPLFMYIIEVIIAFNYIAVPAYQLFTKQAIQPFPLPGNVLLLFGSCLLGYTTFDQVNQFLGAPGDSKIETPLLKMSNTPKGK
jgi:hypothetical protein